MSGIEGAVVVFLGGSLPLDHASAILDAVYLPPAEQGAVFSAVQRFAPRAIVLIDGAFGRVPAVRHKEILYALSRGVAVHGAASMGALRAAELCAEGMIGHGLIYRWYRRFPLLDDDEVAVAMTPAEFGSEPLGDALIDMRLTFRRAERVGRIPHSLRCELERIATSVHFAERNYARVFAEAGREGGHGAVLRALETWIVKQAVNQKAADAALALRAVATGGAAMLEPPPHAITASRFELTESWLADIADSGLPFPPHHTAEL